MTMVTIAFHLPIEGADTATNPKVQAALEALADVMLVQAEDGLYLLGSPDAESFDGVENEYVAGIGSGQRYTITTHGPDVVGASL